MRKQILQSGDVDVRLSNIARDWGHWVATASEEVVILSPYLTTLKTINRVPAHVPLLVLTDFSLELFASGASSIRVLKQILKREKAELYWLPGLHAKIVCVDNRVMTIGSQNMTSRGEKNREATSIVRDEQLCKVVVDVLAYWREEAVSISLEMIEEMEVLLPPVRRAYRKFKLLCDESDGRFDRLFQMTVEERYKAEAARIEAGNKLLEVQRRIDSGVAWVREQIESFFPGDTVSEEVAKDFVSKSAWWVDHPTAHRDIRAPGASKHLYRISWLGYCWSYASDSNKFMVERAIIACKRIVLSLLDERPWRSGNWSHDDLVGKLKNRLFDFVANCNNEEYPGRYGGIRNNDIVFGKGSLDMNDFARCFTMDYAGMAPLFEAIDEAATLQTAIGEDEKS